MSDFIEDFYYGNIEPQEISTTLSTELKRKLHLLSQTEEQLTSKLTDTIGLAKTNCNFAKII